MQIRKWARKGASNESTSKAPAMKDSKLAGMDYAEFKKKAKPFNLRIGEEVELKAVPKEFSTGSFGWSANGNKNLSLDGQGDEKVDVVISVNFTVKGSKPGSTSKKTGQSSAAPLKARGRGKKRKAPESDDKQEAEEAEKEDEELTEVSGEQSD